jgi:phage terminase Nu1 subunit (DNA packaging protein)
MSEMVQTTISRAELADLMGVSETRISQLAAEGVLVRKRAGFYPREENIALATRWLDEKEKLKSRQPCSPRLELVRLQAEMLKLKLEQARGELLPRKDVEETWSARVLAIRSQLLALPSKLASKVALFKTETEAEETFRQEIYDCLRALAAGSNESAPPNL